MALHALSHRSIQYDSQIGRSRVKSHVSRERCVEVKLFEEQRIIRLHLREVAPAMLQHIAIAQTM